MSQGQYPDALTARAARRICRIAGENGGRGLLVGGCVRDALLGRPVKDVDMEIHGLPPDKLKAALAGTFKFDLIGESFAVLKVKGLPLELSLPRRDRKIGSGHKGFEVESDPFMDPREAAARRDFTINSMMRDPESGELLDFFGGESDLRSKTLRHTSEHFDEDPLRVLRAMQFASRMEFVVADETIELARGMTMEELPPERIFEEWKKLLVKGGKPSLGLGFLKDCGWIRFFPELEAMIGCPQEPRWHPEGDAWTHTARCLDGFAKERVGDEWEDLVVGLAVLCHDLGKPSTTSFSEARIRSPRHESEGEAPTRAFLERLTRRADLINQVVVLVANHMKAGELLGGGAGDNAVRRLARRVGRIDRLVRVSRADKMGVAREFDFEAEEWLLERARQLDVASRAPKPIVMGRHLIDLGLEPGPRFGELLGQCFEAQLEGEFDDLNGGMAFLKTLL